LIKHEFCREPELPNMVERRPVSKLIYSGERSLAMHVYIIRVQTATICVDEFALAVHSFFVHLKKNSEPILGAMEL